jgi:hypothetical protein
MTTHLRSCPTLPITLEASLAIASLSPLLLTHVCSRWRKVTHGTSILWVKCNLKYNPDADVTQTKDRLLAQVQLWLQNCGNRGVTLGFSCIPQEDEAYVLDTQMESCVHNMFTYLTNNNNLADRVRGLDIVWPHLHSPATLQLSHVLKSSRLAFGEVTVGFSIIMASIRSLIPHSFAGSMLVGPPCQPGRVPRALTGPRTSPRTSLR